MTQPLGRTELQVTKLGFGAMELRGPSSWRGRELEPGQAESILNEVLDAGINFIDTAETYPIYPKKETCGKTEEIIGNWLKAKKNRDKIILGSKIASNLSLIHI